jgi:hypothetical protein
MPYFINEPKKWRERADQLRKQLETITDPIVRRTLQQVIEAYERMIMRDEQAAMRAERRKREESPKRT